jgi:excisionase family DNA binding protein
MGDTGIRSSATEQSDLPRSLPLPPWLHSIVHDDGRLTLSDYEAARLMGISRGSVRAAIAENRIEVVYLGRRLLVLLIPLLKMMGVDDQAMVGNPPQ